MILHYEDWFKYPSAIIDLKTRNKTALKLAKLLQNKNIKNHAFFLALHDPELSGVDVYDTSLSDELKHRVAIELSINPWYYFREVAMAPARGGITPNIFRLNRANIAAYWLFFNHIYFLLLQVRQTGKSISLDQLYINILLFTGYNLEIDLLTKDNGLRQANIERLKDIIELLPPYLNLRTKKDSNNTEYITVNAMKNVLKTFVGQTTKSGALKVGRGITSSIIGIDEISFIANIELILPTILASMGAAKESAKESNQPYGVAMYTTAGYLEDKEGRYVYNNIYKKATRWSDSLYDIGSEDKLKALLEKKTNSLAPIVLLEFTHTMLGYSDEWLKRRIAEAMADGARAEADFLLIWSSGSSESVIPKEIIKVLNDSIQDYTTILDDSGLYTNWYVNPDDYINRAFVIGIDTSDAIGEDSIAIVARDVEDGSVIFVADYREINISDFILLLFNILKNYHHAILIPERKSSAITILDNLVKLLIEVNINPFKRVFNFVVHDYDIKPDNYSEVLYSTKHEWYELYIKHKKLFGYNTTSSGRTSRELLYGTILKESLKYTAPLTRDRELITQLRGLRRKNNRIDHSANSHDDLVIAYLLGFYFLTRARNIEFYNITPVTILSKVTPISSKELQDAKKSRDIIDKINRALEQLPHIKSLIKRKQLENKIYFLKSKLDYNTAQSLNIEEKIKAIKRRIH
jgi:hypothetical protein